MWRNASPNNVQYKLVSSVQLTTSYGSNNNHAIRGTVKKKLAICNHCPKCVGSLGKIQLSYVEGKGYAHPNLLILDQNLCRRDSKNL